VTESGSPVAGRRPPDAEPEVRDAGAERPPRSSRPARPKPTEFVGPRAQDLDQKTREKLRLRFAKTGAFRFIGHHDVLRYWARWLRRAEIPVLFTEGFHAKPALSSPLALGLGIEGLDELLEIELTEPMSDDEVLRRLEAAGEPSLRVVGLSRHGYREPARVVAVEYSFPIPAESRAAVRERASAALAAESLPTLRTRPDHPDKTVDVRPFLRAIEVEEDRVRFRLTVSPAGTARPEEVLAALGLKEAMLAGEHLVRTKVELAALTDLETAPAPDASRPSRNPGDPAAAAPGRPEGTAV
jgi:radical SAM-linked protein